ncbi:hypothetical protein AB9H28_25550, partial [Salmonella enterica subsp. enterica serovar Kentucky]
RQIVVMPGRDTVVDVQSKIYLRDKVGKLGSTLVIPLRGENQRVMGTIKLYEAKNRLFSSINRTLGEGIAQLLSAQILAGQYERLS